MTNTDMQAFADIELFFTVESRQWVSMKTSDMEKGSM